MSNWVSDRTDMGYPVAIDGQKKMEETWMAAGGRQGIPSAFIVDGTGMIAWVGHPGGWTRRRADRGEGLEHRGGG